jgi:hypothetical protein
MEVDAQDLTSLVSSMQLESGGKPRAKLILTLHLTVSATSDAGTL